MQRSRKAWTSEGKAREPGFLTNERLIYSGHTLIEKLYLLFNAKLNEKHVTKMFKVGKFIYL